MVKVAASLALFFVVALMQLVAADLDGELRELEEVSSILKKLRQTFIGSLRNSRAANLGDLELKVKEVEKVVGPILDEMLNVSTKMEEIEKKVNSMKNKVDKHSADISAACNASTCAALNDTLHHIESCLADVESEDCPHSEDPDHPTVGISSIVANAEAIAKKCNATQCAAIEANLTSVESCLADSNSTHCPAAPAGKTSVKDAIVALLTKPVFSCYTTEVIKATGTIDGTTITSEDVPITTYTKCDVNKGNDLDVTTGKFTVAKAGKYRLTFMCLLVPYNLNEIYVYIGKTPSGSTTETKLIRSSAKSANGDKGNLEQQFTTTIDFIATLAVGDTLLVHAVFTDTSKSATGTTYSRLSGTQDPPQTYFTGEYISA